MLTRFLLALVVAILTTLVLLLAATVLADTPSATVNAISVFLRVWSELIGILVGVWYFLTGATL